MSSNIHPQLVAELLSAPRCMRLWHQLSHDYTLSPFQDPVCSEAMMRDGVVGIRVGAAEAQWLSVFKPTENNSVMRCAWTGSPFLGPPVTSESVARAILNAIQLRMRAELYFPLVYTEFASGISLLRSDAIRWERLPSPTIGAAAFRKGLLPRAEQRLGSRATRRVRKFMASGARVETAALPSGFEDVLCVERASWKHECGQSLEKRGQAGLYRALLDSPRTLLRIAYDSKGPIGYRLDMKICDVLSVLKWSYAQRASGLSPGFYLLAQDLPACWSEESVNLIDLHGSPDTLKSSISDEGCGRRRFDFLWPPDASCFNRVSSERLEHDERIRQAHRSGRSIRQLYAQPTSHNTGHSRPGSV